MYGYYNWECQTNLNRKGDGKYNFAEKRDEVSLVMAFHMNKKNHLNLWYINTGYNNHMGEDKLHG